MELTKETLAGLQGGQAEIIRNDNVIRAEIETAEISDEELKLAFCWSAVRQGNVWAAASVTSYSFPLAEIFSAKYGDGIEIVNFRQKMVLHLYPKTSFPVRAEEVKAAAVEVEATYIPGTLQSMVYSICSDL